MKIKVTLGHIAKSSNLKLDMFTRMNMCPIALAIKDATGQEYCVGKTGVYAGSTYMGNKICDTPIAAQDFITRFDDTGKGYPSEFEFNLPQ